MANLLLIILYQTTAPAVNHSLGCTRSGTLHVLLYRVHGCAMYPTPLRGGVVHGGDFQKRVELFE